MQPRLLALLVAAFFAFAAAPARAAMMRHHDLASLALQAEAIVLAKRGAERTIAPYVTVVEHRIEAVYAGPLHVGDVIEVSYDGALLQPSWGWPGVARDAGPPVISDEVVLFLAPADSGAQLSPDAGPPPAWRLVPSGLRIFVNGLAYRFEQQSNPGPYEPVPQRADPFDVMNDPRAGAQLDRPALVRAIGVAIERARAARAAIAAQGSPEGRKALVDLIGPPDDMEDAPESPDGFPFWEDTVATRAIEALTASGDVDALLDGAARVHGGVSFFMIRPKAPAPQLFTAASSPAVPLHRRLAALALLVEASWRDLQGDATLTQATALYDDPTPEVRAAALALRLPADPPSPRLTAAVIARWRRETDPRVKLALLTAADRLGLEGRLPPVAGSADAPIVWAERHRRVLGVMWRGPGQALHRLVGLTVTARAAGQAAATLELIRGFQMTSAGHLVTSAWNDSRGGGVHAFLDFNPPLAPGRYELEARVDLEDDAHHRVSRTLALRPLRTGLVAAPLPSPSTTEAAAPAAPSLTITAPPPTRPPHTCNCSVPGGGGGEGSPAVFAVLVGAGAVLRRRRTSGRFERAAEW